MSTLATIIAALQVAVAAPHPPADAPPVQQESDIVVHGRSLAATAAALQACIDRHCPTDEDVDATIGHAQVQVLNGDYRGARTTLAASIDRNRKQAKRYPKPVSDLYLVQSRVSLHLGEPEFVRNESLEAVRALRAGLDDDDRLIFSQRLDQADSRARLGNWEGAVEQYRQIEADARRAGQIDVATFSKFKLAVLYGALAEHHSVFAVSARQQLRELADLKDPQLKPFVDAAAVLASRLRIKGQEGPSIDDLIARNVGTASSEPVLLRSPPIKLFEDAPLDGSVTSQLATDADFGGQWIDIGFRVQPDGTVEDVQLIGRSPALRDWWVRYVTDSIRGRRYAPLTPAQRTNAVRAERYTMTSFWGTVTGSHVRRRTPRPYVQALDITPLPQQIAAR